MDKELQLGAMLGPFPNIHYDEFHCSPLLTRPKDGNKRRVILDLSYPRGVSVHDAVTKEKFDNLEFTLTFPTIDNIVDQIKATQGRVLLAKIDMARAFRNLRVDPADTFKFGLKWGGGYYLDVAVAFGWTHGSSAFQMTSDAIVHIMSKENCKIFAYIDDYVIVSAENDAWRHFDKLSALLTELGLPMNENKRSPPTRVITCLGITIDLDNNSLSIVASKLQEIYQECYQVMSKKTLTRRQFQSLLGKLIYLHKCIKPARIFINRILSLFRNNPHAKKIKLTEDFFLDVHWFIKVIPRFAGTTKIFKSEVQHIESLHIDACLTGVGGTWANRVYAAPVPTFVNLELNITHLEMLNILVAFRLWAHHWAQSTVRFYCDNMAVVQVVNSGKTRDAFLQACTRNIWFITATHDIDLQIEHIQGHKNVIADALSRIYSPKGITQKMLNILNSDFVWDDITIHYFNLDLHL